MRSKALIVFSAPLLLAATYTDAQLAGGFAQFVAMGKDISPLLSAELPEATVVELKQLEGCNVIEVESLNADYVGYGIQWKCRRKPKGVKTAAVVKIAEGKIFQVLMSDVS